ncbi:hypothetical protein MRX96_035497 [Rhipicephalus microplus]
MTTLIRNPVWLPPWRHNRQEMQEEEADCAVRPATSWIDEAYTRGQPTGHTQTHTTDYLVRTPSQRRIYARFLFSRAPQNSPPPPRITRSSARAALHAGLRTRNVRCSSSGATAAAENPVCYWEAKEGGTGRMFCFAVRDEGRRAVVPPVV